MGGDSDCEHICGNQVQDNKAVSAITQGVRPGADMTICRKCGAKRVDQQIGLEKTPDCGLHGKLRLRKDLTPDQIKYVVQRLLDAGCFCE